MDNTHETQPPQHYAEFDESGNLCAFYINTIHKDAIPEHAIPISEEDWRLYNENGTWKYKLDNGIIREKTQEELDAEAANLPPLPPSPEERITQLEAENAELWYELMFKKPRQESMLSKLNIFGKRS